MNDMHPLLLPPGPATPNDDAGTWLIKRARYWQAKKGTHQAAKNLRKWAVPLQLALQLLRKPA